MSLCDLEPATGTQARTGFRTFPNLASTSSKTCQISILPLTVCQRARPGRLFGLQQLPTGKLAEASDFLWRGKFSLFIFGCAPWGRQFRRSSYRLIGGIK